MPTITWAKPAPLWQGTIDDMRDVGFERPALVELKSDNFLPEFLDLMEGRVAGKTPAELAAMRPQLTEGRLKLYQPLHGRYYLVVGSLVCRQIGLPDRNVVRKRGEATSFVVRRMLADGTVQGWVAEGARQGWQPLVDEHGQTVSIRADEERLPLHPVTLCKVADAGQNPGLDAFGLTACGRRAIYYGYIPVSRRDTYLDRQIPRDASAAATAQQYASALAAFQDKEASPQLTEVDTRVIGLWRGMYLNEKGQALPAGELAGLNERLSAISLYLLIDFADCLHRSLPHVFKAITSSDDLSARPAQQALVTELGKIALPVVRKGGGNATISLATALKELKDHLGLVYGQGAEPDDVYKVREATYTHNNVTKSMESCAATYLASLAPPPPGVLLGGSLLKYIGDALAEAKTPLTLDEETAALLRDQVALAPNEADPDEVRKMTYYVQLVYEHAPCVPVVSQPSDRFTFAAPFDADAPARHIRIEMPSIKPKDLRKLKRGVGMQMSPELRKLMSRVNKDMVKGDGLGPDGGGWDLAMICSFSIQIIMLVAFIVMFIFLILLNFVFWWLPFLKICFPIPVKKSS